MRTPLSGPRVLVSPLALIRAFPSLGMLVPVPSERFDDREDILACEPELGVLGER
jgi:hypothetical protein